MADILDFGPDKPPWRPSRRAIIAGVVVLAAVAVVGISIALAGHRGPDAAAPSPSSSVTVVPDPDPDPVVTGPTCPPAAVPEPATRPAALTIGCATKPGSSLDRRDRTAGQGPWTVVVRRNDGSLGRNSAVITYPAPGGASPALGTRTWRLLGASARIHGDLPESDLDAIIAGTTVVRGRPVVDPPAGFTATSTGSFRPPTIHEIRYGTADLGEQEALDGGLTFTGTVSGGGYDDQILLMNATPAGQVDGRPAVLTMAFGGNGALAWEPVPGVIAYIGYSGAPLDAASTAALQRLAARARALTAEQWQATGPQPVDQTNEPG